LLIGALTGSASAVFLWTLEWATNYREANLWIIALLPISGLIIGLSYHYYGESVVKGNNLLIEEFHSPKKIIPFKMAPLVFIGTILTHLFGGSAVVRELLYKLVVQLQINLLKFLNFLTSIEKLY